MAEASKTAERLKETVNRLTADEITDLINADHRCNGPLPSGPTVERIVALCRALLFPGYFSDSGITAAAVPYTIGVDVHELTELLTEQIASAQCFAGGGNSDLTDACSRPSSAEIALQFVESLPELRRLLHTDVQATYLADPAALSTREVIFCYPGLRATCNHRIAHCLHRLGVPILPRMISESAHRETGIDIHPAATIGESFVIDHGTGVVIGATAVLGHHVTIYQGVTLGAKSFVTDAENNPVKGLPRHPQIGNHVVVYSNASILGRVNVGDGAVIGGNVWLTRDVAPGEKVLQGGIKTPNQ